MAIESVAEFVWLRLSRDPSDQHRAEEDCAPDEVWEEVIANRPDMKRWVAFNRTVPFEILRRLARDEDPDVRWAVAGRRNLDRELFALLADDPDPGVRRRVAWNAKVPYDLLLQLARDQNDSIAVSAQLRLEVLPARKRRTAA